MKELYDQNYYTDFAGTNYHNQKLWSYRFQWIADKIIADFNPKTVLDAGCAFGYLVVALRKRGVQAYGIDISDYAISQADASIKDFCYVGSLSEDFPDGLPKSYDLVINIEILEHLMEEDGIKAIKNLCKLSDTVIFSSTPDDFEDKTHFNVQPLEYWTTQFAKNEFYRDLFYQATYISEQAVVFKKGKTDIYKTIQKYEKALYFRENKIREMNKKRFSYKIKKSLYFIVRKLKKR